jgi:hypothetical protein
MAHRQHTRAEHELLRYRPNDVVAQPVDGAEALRHFRVPPPPALARKLLCKEGREKGPEKENGHDEVWEEVMGNGGDER